MALPFTLAVFLPLFLAGDSAAKELRPSDHGLIFQTLSPAGPHSSPGMRSFFNSQNSSPIMSSSSSDVAFPRAMDSGEASPPLWWRAAGDGSGERVRKALTVASLVCGVAGAVLLVVSGLVYVLKCRKRKEKLNAGFCGGENGNGDDNNEEKNKLQLVVANP
ncbi:hypothetical protein RJT34_03486 [Clitoria ternatea]|uniref:Uncharacterized protein n=1 Tax=Clitoria ternatea TaxID=43366 RepID=A0AAN9KKA9_CLITE